MKVWVTLTLAVAVAAWACWISMHMHTVEQEPQQSISSATEKTHKFAIYKVKFNTDRATRNSYMMFMNDLHNALTDDADRNGDIPILPPPSPQPTDPRQYLYVELSNGMQIVALALNISNVYILGYQPGGKGSSYFFRDVPNDVRKALFPNTTKEELPFTGRYDALESAAGVHDRTQIPLGINVLRQHIDNMNYLQPNTRPTSIARALIVCIQMVSEAARLRNIRLKILAVAEPNDGVYGEYNPDRLMIAYENSWGKISSAIQSATDGIFRTPVRLVHGGQVTRLNTTREVLFTIAIMPAICVNRGAYMLPFHIATSASSFGISSLSSMDMRSTGSEDNADTDPCEAALAPTSHITGQNGLCVDVYQGSYHNENKIILWECGQNQANQLWTLRTDDNTIRSGGKCLTTYGYSSKDYVMIYDCDTAVSAATKWEIRSDGMIRNPKSGLVLTGNKDTSGMINLVVDFSFYGSRQAWYASNSTEPSVTSIVGYKGLCLLASGSQVWLEKCLNNYAEQQWAIYPDQTIRPQKNREGCLKYADSGGDLVTVGTCDGYVEERWRFQSNGTILHVVTDKLMDVKYTDATLPRITVNSYSDQRPSQIWFQIP